MSSLNRILISIRQAKALSGASKMVKKHMEFFTKQGFEVHLVAEKADKTWCEEQNIIWHKAKKWPFTSKRQRLFFAKQVYKLSKKIKPQIHIGHGDSLEQDILFIHNRVHHAEEVLGFPKKAKHYSKYFHEKIFIEGKTKVFVCNSQAMKKDLTNRFSLSWPTEVIYPGVENNLVEKVNPQAVKDLRKLCQCDSEQILIGLIASGNLDNRGAKFLMESYAQLPEESLVKTKLLVVGKDSRPERFFELADKLNIKNHFTYLEPRSDVENLISAVDILVHPAKSEAFGMIVLEAMSLQKPIIATDTVGSTEIFPHSSKNYIINHNENLLKEKLNTLILQKDLRHQLASDNQEAAKKFYWSSHLQNLFTVIKKLV